MLGKTHKAGGALAMLVAFHYMYNNGMLTDTIHPLIQLLVMYPASSWGSTAPDLDLGENAIPDKTPVSYLVHKVLHLMPLKHRSWQTHSLLAAGSFIALLFVGVWYISTYGIFNLNAVSLTILQLLLMGLTVGLASHLVLDMFTRRGIPLLPPIKSKGKEKTIWLRLVPNIEFFGTGTIYERIVQVLLYVAIGVYAVYMLYSIFVPVS